MDFQQAKNHLLSKKPVSTGSTGIALVTFGPVSVPREDLVSDLSWLHEITKAEDFETAVSFGWHKVSDKNGRERMSRIVTFYRISQDGKTRPPFLWQEEYLNISGAKPAPVLTLEP